MCINNKKMTYQKMVLHEIVSFFLIIILIWLDEIWDIPYWILGAPITPFNWRESLFESVFIIMIAAIIIKFTKKTFDRMKHLEGMISICCSCKKIKDENGNWDIMEAYIHNKSDAEFTHGICLDCMKKLYPEIVAEMGLDTKSLSEK